MYLLLGYLNKGGLEVVLEESPSLDEIKKVLQEEKDWGKAHNFRIIEIKEK